MLLSLAGCGLERLSIVLASPVGVINAVDSKFEFNSTSANNEAEFRGYEIYYKLFLSNENPLSYYASIEELIAASYHRLNNPGTDRPGVAVTPLIFVDFDLPNADRGDPFTVTIDFSNFVAPGDYPKISLTGAALNGEDTTMEVLAARRSVQNPGFNELKRFNLDSFKIEDVTATNSDLTEPVLNEIVDLSTAGVVCFAVSWGIDAYSNLVYSVPTWLGFEKIVFPQNEIIF